jgi:hypothetical protein
MQHAPYLCAAFILIGLLALAMAHPVTAIPIALALYAIWRTC